MTEITELSGQIGTSPLKDESPGRGRQVPASGEEASLQAFSPAPRVILAGGSGFLGQRLQRLFTAAGYEVVVLSRREGGPASSAGVRTVTWDPAKFGPWTRELDGAAILINLAGRNVNCRSTAASRKEILKSRLNSVRALAEAVRRCSIPPSVWIQAGSLAIHGDSGPLWCDETAPAGERGSAPDVCTQWEAVFFKAPLPSAVRRVMLRLGLVLDRGGGSLPLLSRLTRLFLGAPAGSGRQFISWLHAHDFDRILLRCATDPGMEGLYTACTAGAVTNAEFMEALRTVHRRPWLPAIPAFPVRVAAWLSGSDASLLLTGRRGLPGRLMEAGFRFDYPALGPALDELLLGPRLPAPLSTVSPPAPVAAAAAH